MDDSKKTVSMRHNRNYAHVSSQRLCQDVQGQCRFKPDWGPSAEREKWHKLPPLTKKLFLIDNHWQGENQFPTMEFHLGYKLPSNRWPMKNELSGIIVVFFSHNVLFGIFLSYSSFACLLYIYSFETLYVCVSCAFSFFLLNSIFYNFLEICLIFYKQTESMELD